MNRLPRTVSEAVEKILNEMKSADKRTVRDTPEEELIEFHFGWGQGIRNSMGLWRGNIELLEDTGVSHPDDASMVIIQAVWKQLQSMDDAEIESSSAANGDRLDFNDMQDAVRGLGDFMDNLVPRGVHVTAKSNDGSITVVVAPADDLLTSEIEKFMRNRVPQGVNCSVKCDDRSVSGAASLVDNPETECGFGSIRTFPPE